MAAVTDGTGDADRWIVVHVAARLTLRSLRPVLRVVLEDVALDAVWQDGRLVASTSARLVAEHLGVDPGTAASALRVLRDRGLVELEQHTQSDGRFGLAGYTVHLPPGLDVTPSTDGDRPHTAEPSTVEADAASITTDTKRVRRTAPRSKRAEQATLDLGLGTR
jgi:DNA-binding transcriptional ArsR family regulator